VLRSNHAGAVGVGSPVFFRQIQVGQVVSSQLEPDSDYVTTRVFVRPPRWRGAPTAALERERPDIGSANGVKIDRSLVPILTGGSRARRVAGFRSRDRCGRHGLPAYANHGDAGTRHYADHHLAARIRSVGARTHRGRAGGVRILIGQVTITHFDEAAISS
jgi:paraquat-inducible protein B